ncbi:DUF6474 family protein, partial [Mycobacterium avium]
CTCADAIGDQATDPRHRAAHAAISSQLDGIEADLMARLGLS